MRDGGCLLLLLRSQTDKDFTKDVLQTAHLVIYSLHFTVNLMLELCKRFDYVFVTLMIGST